MLFNRYILSPLKVIFSNPIILLFVFVITIFNLFSNKLLSSILNIQLELKPEWIYYKFPALILRLLDQKMLEISIISFLVFLCASIISVNVMLNITEVYRGRVYNFKTIFTRNLTKALVWFFIAEVILHLVFGLIGLLMYICCLFLYRCCQIDLILLLLGLSVFLYPFFYLLLSFSAMMAVLPLTSVDKISKFNYIFMKKNFFQIYIFYLVRIGMEMGLLIFCPLLISYFGLPTYLFSVSIALILTIPFAFFRGSGYEIKLLILSNDKQINTIFQSYYDKIYTSN